MPADDRVAQTVIEYANRLKMTDAQFRDLRDQVARELGMDLGSVTLWAGFISSLEPYGRDGWQLLNAACQRLPPAVRLQRACKELIELLTKLESLARARANAVTDLNDRLRWQAPASWEEIYRRSADELGLHERPKNLRTALTWILGVKHGGDFEFVRFIERLANQMDRAAAELRQLNTEVAASLEISHETVEELRTEIKDEPLDVRPHVLARIVSNPDGKALTVWKYYSSRTPGRVTERLRFGVRLDGGTRPLNDYREVATALLTMLDGMLYRTGEKGQPVLSVMLPWEDLDTAVQDWSQTTIMDGVVIGRLIPVMVRPHAELDTDMRAHRERWNEIHKGVGTAGRICKDHTDCAGWPWLCLAVIAPTTPREAAGAARKAGIPTVIWRRDRLDPSGSLNADDLMDLPDLVLAARRNGGPPLAAVWDDPYWIPGESELEWRG